MEHLATALLLLQLLVIGSIDFRRFLIPDWCNALLAVSGLAAGAIFGSFDLVASLMSVLIFGGLFWAIRQLHQRTTGRVGLGLGDVKMAAATGCWIGIEDLSLFLAVASLSGLIFAAGLGVFRGNERVDRIPFGPFLGAGLMASWLFDANWLAYSWA